MQVCDQVEYETDHEDHTATSDAEDGTIIHDVVDVHYADPPPTPTPAAQLQVN